MKEYPEYNNEEIRYEKKTDPREHNVVEMIKTLEQRKSEVPRLDDREVHMHDLKCKLEDMKEQIEEEVQEDEDNGLIEF